MEHIQIYFKHLCLLMLYLRALILGKVNENVREKVIRNVDYQNDTFFKMRQKEQSYQLDAELLD